MYTKTIEDLRARYNKREIVVDEFGRQITVTMLRPAEQFKIREFGDPSDQVLWNSMFIACSVRAIDGVVFVFPKTRADLDLVFNVLDREGIEAAGKGVQKLNPPAEADAPTSETEAVDAAKN